jgi:hypothetical protein
MKSATKDSYFELAFFCELRESIQSKNSVSVLSVQQMSHEPVYVCCNSESKRSVHWLYLPCEGVNPRDKLGLYSQ